MGLPVSRLVVRPAGLIGRSVGRSVSQPVRSFGRSAGPAAQVCIRSRLTRESILAHPQLLHLQVYRCCLCSPMAPAGTQLRAAMKRPLAKQETLGSYSDQERPGEKAGKKPRANAKAGILARCKETRPGGSDAASSSNREPPGLPEPVSGSQLPQLDGAGGQFPKPGEGPTVDALLGLAEGEGGSTTQAAELSQLPQQPTPPAGQVVASLGESPTQLESGSQLVAQPPTPAPTSTTPQNHTFFPAPVDGWGKCKFNCGEAQPLDLENYWSAGGGLRGAKMCRKCYNAQRILNGLAKLDEEEAAYLKNLKEKDEETWKSIVRSIRIVPGGPDSQKKTAIKAWQAISRIVTSTTCAQKQDVLFLEKYEYYIWHRDHKGWEKDQADHHWENAKATSPNSVLRLRGQEERLPVLLPPRITMGKKRSLEEVLHQTGEVHNDPQLSDALGRQTALADNAADALSGAAFQGFTTRGLGATGVSFLGDKAVQLGGDNLPQLVGPNAFAPGVPGFDLPSTTAPPPVARAPAAKAPERGRKGLKAAVAEVRGQFAERRTDLINTAGELHDKFGSARVNTAKKLTKALAAAGDVKLPQLLADKAASKKHIDAYEEAVDFWKKSRPKRRVSTTTRPARTSNLSTTTRRSCSSPRSGCRAPSSNSRRRGTTRTAQPANWGRGCRT